MKQKQNHYETLGVSPNAEDIVIRASYRALAQKYHPDKSTDPMASVKMMRLNAAYVVLSDSQKRLRYDAESSLDSFAPDSSTSRDTQVTLADHLDSCGVKNITSDNIYFYPNIPAKKLAGARSSYVFGPMEEDILILIDDTVFGSAKDGAVVTSDRLFIKGKFDAITVFQLSDVNQLACEDNEITVNRRRVGSLSLVGKMEARYVFHEISSFLTALARSRSQAAHPVDPALEIDTAEMERLLSKYLTPVAMKNGVDLTRFNGRYPGYYLGDKIPDTLARTVRFLLGIPTSDRLFAVVDLWDGQGEAVVFTNRGVYSRCRASDVVTAYDWSSLRGRSVRGEFEISVFNGVVFDDGRKLICGRQSAVLKPFGKLLISDLLRSLSDTPAPEYQSANEMQEVLKGTLQIFRDTFNDQDGLSAAEDSPINQIAVFLLDGQTMIVANAFPLEVANKTEADYLVRVASAQFLVMLLAVYSASIVPAVAVTAMGMKTFLSFATFSVTYFEYCMDRNRRISKLPDFYRGICDPQVTKIVMTVLLPDVEPDISDRERIDKRTEFVKGMLAMECFGLYESEQRTLISQSTDLSQDWLKMIERLVEEEQQ